MDFHLFAHINEKRIKALLPKAKEMSELTGVPHGIVVVDGSDKSFYKMLEKVLPGETTSEAWTQALERGLVPIACGVVPISEMKEILQTARPRWGNNEPDPLDVLLCTGGQLFLTAVKPFAGEN